MVEEVPTSLIKLGKIRVRNKYQLLDILWFASTEEYQADR
jgi:hypothetical protein